MRYGFYLILFYYLLTTPVFAENWEPNSPLYRVLRNIAYRYGSRHLRPFVREDYRQYTHSVRDPNPDEYWGRSFGIVRLPINDSRVLLHYGDLQLTEGLRLKYKGNNSGKLKLLNLLDTKIIMRFKFRFRISLGVKRPIRSLSVRLSETFIFPKFMFKIIFRAKYRVKNENLTLNFAIRFY